jgi:hypothetical protein
LCAYLASALAYLNKERPHYLISNSKKLDVFALIYKRLIALLIYFDNYEIKMFKYRSVTNKAIIIWRHQ